MHSRRKELNIVDEDLHRKKEKPVHNSFAENTKIDETYLPLLTASGVKRHLILGNHDYIKYGDNLAAKRDEKISKRKEFF